MEHRVRTVLAQIEDDAMSLHFRSPSAPGYAVCSFLVIGVFPTTLWVHVFTEFAFIDTWNFAKTLAPIEERRGNGIVGASLLPFWWLTSDVVLLFPVQRQSHELPATTVGECRRRHSL